VRLRGRGSDEELLGDLGQVGRAVIDLQADVGLRRPGGDDASAAAQDPPGGGGPTRPRAGDSAGSGRQGGTTAPRGAPVVRTGSLQGAPNMRAGSWSRQGRHEER
jgi:hypothetical protein